MAELASRDIVALSPSMVTAMDTATKLSRYDAPQLLITGDNGTGKSLIAKFIHSKSCRSSEPFLHINCGSLPENLLEAELFGYETEALPEGSPEGQLGIFEIADKGTVFLDEVGELPEMLQSRLLNFLDTHTFRRIGGHRTISSDANVIAATTKNLREMMELKYFRSDLYFRLCIFRLDLPPLRERKEDILELARRELIRLNAFYNLDKELDALAIDVLYAYDFPGNIRQLLNSIHQAVLLSEDKQIGIYLAKILEITPSLSSQLGLMENSELPKLTSHIAEIERQSLVDALSVCRTNREMADYLGVSQSSISRKLKKYNLPLPKEKSDNKKKRTKHVVAPETTRVNPKKNPGEK
jgi:transcriptional regulator with PAS, ATPase and Fis domain